MAESQILVPDLVGFHNRQGTKRAYRDRRTICIVPAVRPIAPRIVFSWRNLMTPMNSAFIMLMPEGLEVGAAYSSTVEMILGHPDLSTWPYILTLETDNAPPPDGLLKLIEDMEEHPEFAAIGGLYWTKGEGGMPMAYGKPGEMPRTFAPWSPPPDSVTQVNGLGMGFTLFRTKVFQDERLPRPIFETMQRYEPYVGAQAWTQDLKFFDNINSLGYKVASSTRVLVGHLGDDGVMW